MEKILIVDDDADVREDISGVLANAGYVVDMAVSGNDALEKALSTSSAGYDIVLLDLVMPGLTGMEVLREIKKVLPKLKVIMITAFSTVESAIEAIKNGASDYISKPFKIDELLRIISRVIEEAKFETRLIQETKGNEALLDVDNILLSLANPIRRKIIRLLDAGKNRRFMEIIKELGMMEEHQKVVFHLKMLKHSGIIEQEKDKSYTVTKEGARIIKSLDVFEKYLLAQ
jgi:DNA-binding response OmpR family regulator